MEVKCDSCQGTDWKMVIHEERVFGQSMVYSAIKCEGCGMVYPLLQLGKNVSKEQVISRLKD